MIILGYCKKKLEGKWITIYVNEEQYLPYWKPDNKMEKVVMVPQNGSISSSIHYQRGVYSYNINYYEIKKTFPSTS